MHVDKTYKNLSYIPIELSFSIKDVSVHYYRPTFDDCIRIVLRSTSLDHNEYLKHYGISFNYRYAIE